MASCSQRRVENIHNVIVALCETGDFAHTRYEMNRYRNQPIRPAYQASLSGHLNIEYSLIEAPDRLSVAQAFEKESKKAVALCRKCIVKEWCPQRERRIFSSRGDPPSFQTLRLWCQWVRVFIGAILLHNW
jgi:hypothetical protein